MPVQAGEIGSGKPGARARKRKVSADFEPGAQAPGREKQGRDRESSRTTDFASRHNRRGDCARIIAQCKAGPSDHADSGCRERARPAIGRLVGECLRQVPVFAGAIHDGPCTASRLFVRRAMLAEPPRRPVIANCGVDPRAGRVRSADFCGSDPLIAKRTSLRHLRMLNARSRSMDRSHRVGAG
jgi:hypothetical protein